MFDLTTLNGINGFRVEGANLSDWLGGFVSTAGDMNGDELSDLVLGADGADPGGRILAGTAYVIFGQASSWPTSFNLNLTVLDGRNGFRVEGVNAFDALGASVSTAGDINGDGLSDLVLGAPSHLSTGIGMVYVVFGQTGGWPWPASFDLTMLNGSNGFRVEGLKANDYFGASVSTAGDINDDGLADLILGANGADPDGRTDAGTVYVIFGQTNGWPASFNLTTLDGNNGFRVEGVNAGDSLGFSGSTGSDMDGDDLYDLVLGAYGAGTVYVIFGQTNGWPVSFNLTTLDGNNGFRVGGGNAGDMLGFSVSTAGDMNGDGLSDLLLGAPGTTNPSGRIYAGRVYVIFGQASSWLASFNLTTLNGSNGFRVEGEEMLDWLGTSVSTAGDINSDGLSDLVLGAYYARRQAGAAYVIFGRASGWPASFNVSTLNGSNGFQVEGVNVGDALGVSVSAAGDMNGDGQSDLVLGAFFADTGGRSDAGMAYVLFGPRPPQLIHPIPDQTAEFEKHFSFQIDDGTFSDPDGDVLTYSAAQSGSGIFPNWLTLDAATGVFFGTPNQTGITSITVTAKDSYGLTATADFNLNVQTQVSNVDISGIIGVVVVGGVVVIGGLAAGAAYLVNKMGFFASGREKKVPSASPDTEIELTKKTAISLAG